MDLDSSTQCSAESNINSQSPWPHKNGITAPSWFVTHCVRTPEEQSQQNESLKVLETGNSKNDSSVHKKSRKHKFEIPESVYKQLHTLISRELPTTAEPGPRSQSLPLFAFDATVVSFRAGTELKKTSTEFLTAVIEYFAKELNAGLITLDVEDIEDLVEHADRGVGHPVDQDSTAPYISLLQHFGPPQDHWCHISACAENDESSLDDDNTNSDFGTSDAESIYLDAVEELTHDSVDIKGQGNETKVEINAHVASGSNGGTFNSEIPSQHAFSEDSNDVGGVSTGVTNFEKNLEGQLFPINLAALLHAARSKGIERSSDKSISPPRTPFIIHLREVHEIKTICSATILDHFRHSLDVCEGPVLVICSASEPLPCEPCDTKIVSSLSRRSIFRTICLAPASNLYQRKTFESSELDAKHCESKNVRRLQRWIRRSAPEFCSLPILQPFAEWKFYAGSHMQSRFTYGQTSDDLLIEVKRDINGNPDEEYIKHIILQTGNSAYELYKWSFTDQGNIRWSGLSPEAQKVLQTIESAGDEMYWEKILLRTVVNPDNMNEGWSQIELDPTVKSAITRMLNQQPPTNRPVRNLYSRHRVGGALLYGPPGTGKSLLARVMAREFSVSVIFASAADVEGELVGQTEKAIQALFNLGRLLDPSVIFIDEADALFRARSSHDWGHERSRINQFLYEMDGFKSSERAPFVVLATNFPSELDHAVLRRVPTRICIGLPNSKARLRIAEKVLENEILDDNMDLQWLVKQTEGYSGSDVKTVCVQAALICDSDITDTSKSKPVLERSHFEEALLQSPCTVSGASLDSLRAFAAVFDPKSVDVLSYGHGNSIARGLLDSNTLTSKISTGQNMVRSNEAAPWSYAIHKNGACAIHDRHHLPNLGPIRTYFATHRPSTKLSDPESEGAHPVTNGLPKDEAFQYAPLEEGSQQIRVLTILPRGDQTTHDSNAIVSSILRCELKTVDLNEYSSAYRALSWAHNSPRYRLAQWILASTCRRRLVQRPAAVVDDIIHELEEITHIDVDTTLEQHKDIDRRFVWGDYIALSYVWGDSTQFRDLILNGHKFRVTAKLYEILTQLQLSSDLRESGLYIWVDAICINQNDLKERASQVKMMTTIFSQALSVIAWVGNPANDVALEVSVVKAFLDSVHHIAEEDMQATLVPDQVIAHSFWVVLSHMMAESFWNRLWILQEMAVPPSLRFWYGTHSFTFQDLRKMHQLFRRGGLGQKLLYGSLPKRAELNTMDHALYRLRQVRSPDGTSSKTLDDMCHLVNLATESLASDSRDKVYGILSLLPQPISLQIYPDYGPSSTPEEVFLNFSKICYQERGMNMRSRMKRKDCNCQGSTFPSWAIDLDHSCHNGLMSSHNSEFEANLDMPKRNLRFSENNRLLYCEGVVVGSIAIFAGNSNTVKGSVTPSKEPEDPYNNDGIDWRRVISRVLLHEARYDFCQCHPSVFDIPWLSNISGYRSKHRSIGQELGWGIQDPYLHEKSKRWPQFSSLTNVGSMFEDVLAPQADFEIGGKSFQSYFTSTELVCSEPKIFLDIASKVLSGMNDQVLFKTDKNHFGSMPKWAKLGDKIVVVSDCDMPLVLRPKGDAYELIGACFVEGLMRGETARDVERGLLRIETISLC
ncbi:hypothetical protein N0V90_013189 [Kalmusia sp. IMI 367209]|nr:hypothetical protein N0V90_013189 [Kalmusia sp. IMI 367209]